MIELRKSLPDMRKGGLEPPRPITESADPKSAPHFYKERHATEPESCTELHRIVPDCTGRITPGVTCPREVLVRGADVRRKGGVIYGLVDPRQPSRVRYVGQTVGLPESRYRQHIHDSAPQRGRRMPATCARARWISALLAESVYPDMILLERVPDVGAWELTDCERRWIATLGKRNQADLNAPLPRHFVERQRREVRA